MECFNKPSGSRHAAQGSDRNMKNKPGLPTSWKLACSSNCLNPGWHMIFKKRFY